MRFLLDTCTFLWLIWGEPELPPRVRDLISDPGNEVFLSPVSVWEALIKLQAGKLQLKTSEPAWRHFVTQREAHEIPSLPLEEQALAHLTKLPDVHRDPFDRILICQAIERGLTLLTPDPLIQRYPVKVLW